MKQKLFTFFFALVASVGTIFAAGDYNVSISGIIYTLYDYYGYRTAYVTYSSAYSGNVVIPSIVTYADQTYTVTRIDNYAFRGCTGLTSVAIPNSVTSIGAMAFYGCTGLTSVTIPNSVTSIGDHAFEYCSGLTSPIYNAHIFAYMPKNYSGTYSIPDGIVTIAGSAFYNCRSLTSVTIPNSVTSIGSSAFSGCTRLISVTIGNSVTSIGDYAFSGCSSLTSVTIPNSVTSIKQYAFNGCSSLTSITIPNSITSIGDHAFEGCTGLTSATIPNGVTSISVGAFSGCAGLTSVTIGNSVASIGDYAFNGCSSLTSVTIPNSVTNIGVSAFYGCSALTSLTIGNSVTSIGGSAFSHCSSLTSVTIPNSVTSIGSEAFRNWTSLNSVTINSNTIVSQAYTTTSNLENFFGSQVTTYIIGNSVTSIGDYAFYGCTGLTSVTIGNSVTSIGRYAFNGCTGLTSVTIPNSVTSIGGAAFDGCSSLTSITMESLNPPTLSTQYFFDCPALHSIYVPCGSLNAYKKATNWSNYASRIKYHTYEITTNTQNGNVTIMPDEYSVCSDVTLTAIPNEGYYFTQWSDGVTDNPRTIILTQDTTFTAEFAPNQYSINVSCDDKYGHIGGENGTYDYNTEHTYEAFANYGYHFAQWSDGNTQNPRTITLRQDTSVIAIFAKNSYAIQNRSSEKGYIAGVGKYEYLDTVVLTAMPRYGYHFAHWSDGIMDNPRTIVLTQDTSFIAEFEPNQYSINVSCDDIYGHIEGENGVYDYNTEHTFEAIANYGYHFVRWSDGNANNPRTVVLNGDITFSAIFAKNNYTIADNSNPEQGHIEGVGLFEYLDEIILTPMSEYGYHFDHWSDGNKDNPRTIIIIQDTTFTAEFAIDKSGTCGENNALTWTYDDQSKTLTITGNGALTDNYTFGLEAPTEMNTLIIGDGVTAIGDSAFYGMTTINHLFIGANVASIGNYAFAECRNFDNITCYATIVPTINATTFENVGNKQYIYLYVPEDRERAYHRDEFWGEFDIRIKGTEETTTDTKSVTVDPSDNTALFTWPTDSAAASYSLQITKDGEVFCTLIFNSNGQLTGIAFAPSRNGAAHAQAATMSVSAMSFTVTGLSSASKYAYRLSVTDESQNELQAYSGEFATNGYEGEVNEGGEPEINTEGIEDVLFTEKATKILRNGQIFILRGDHTYTLTGQEVK